MMIRAVFLDFGGVVVRTEDRHPRTRLAERFKMTYDEIDQFVFYSESSRLASLGKISEADHWSAVLKELGVDSNERDTIINEFFAGDQIDHALLDLVKGYRPHIQIGLISNAWSGLRAWINSNGIGDAFDHMVISAEVGSVKPEEHIYQIALDAFEVTAQEAVFIDDTLINIEAAEVMGMKTIHFIDPMEAVDKLQTMLDQRDR